MDKKHILEYINNTTYCRLKSSSIHGVGVFAIKKIPKGINPFPSAPDYEAITVSKKDLKNLDPEMKKLLFDLLVFDGDTVDIPVKGLNNLDVSFYLNHSKNPNLKYADDREGFISLRDIEVGEELTADYDILNNPKELDF